MNIHIETFGKESNAYINGDLIAFQEPDYKILRKMKIINNWIKKSRNHNH